MPAWKPGSSDVLQIIREESYYFYPQFHHQNSERGLGELLACGAVSPLRRRVARRNDRVCPAARRRGQSGRAASRSIPIIWAIRILVDIEKRWDEMHAAGETPLTGRQKLFEVRRTEDDMSFLRNYLTPELVEQLDLFAYGSQCTHPPGQHCPQCQRW